MAEVRSDSRICITDPSGKIKTVIHEENYERLGYKAKGWQVIKDDWTKGRKIQPPVDYSQEMDIAKLGGAAKK